MLISSSLKSVSTLFLSISIALIGWGQSPDEIKANFYKAMASSDIALIERELERLEALGPNAEKAYQGALLMKKASLLENAGDKLETFKKGKVMLENAITAVPTNAEFRFLRIMIQENAPKILGYSDNLAEDADVVAASFDELSPELKAAVITYSKNSEMLNTKG